MTSDHPFQILFESFGRLPSSHADSVNRKAYGELLSTLDVETEKQGRCILLRAPRAGHGKTHLLSRVQNQLSGSHEFIPLHPSGNRVGAISVTEDALNRLGRALPAAGGLTVLDLVIRRLFSFALQPLVVSGEVPCQDREGALAALRNRPVETFDFHHPNAVTAHWAKENFEVLGPRLSMELAQRCNLPVREVSFWVNAFFRYAATPVDHPGRAGALGMEVAGEPVTEGVAMERLTSLLALVSLLMRVVVVADDLEGFSADETAALSFAAFIGAIRQHAERVDVIISLNKDIWENAFMPRLSGGLADRLSEVLIELEPLSDDDIIALFDSRAPGLGREVFERVDATERHARGLVRAAGMAWMNAVNEKAESAPMVAPLSDEAGQNIEAQIEVPSQSFEEGIFAVGSEKAPVAAFTAVSSEVEESPLADEVERNVSVSSPQQWGGGSVFDAQVLDEPVRGGPFSESSVSDLESSGFYFQPVGKEAQSREETPSEQSMPDFSSSASYFQSSVQEEPARVEPVLESQPVFQAAPSYFEPVASDEPVQSLVNPGTSVFEPVSQGAGFGPPPPPQPSNPQPAAEGDDRVDDLLKQFRERYGR